MIFGLLDVTMSPQTNYFKFGRHQDTSKNTSNRSRNMVEHIVFGNSKSWNSDILKMLEKADTRNPVDPSIAILKIFDMGSIFSRKHEMKFR